MSDIKVTLNAVKIVTVISNGSNVLAYTKTEVNNLLNAINITNTPSGNISSTTVQGAINELDTEKAPTVHTHDDRYYTETEVNTLLNAKANTTQEAWITPTLLNGWVNNSGSFTSRYKKDSMGVVWVELFVNSGTTNSVIFQLPIGYRPTQFIVITGNASSAVSGIGVSSNGDITHSFGANTNNHRYVFAFRTN